LRGLARDLPLAVLYVLLEEPSYLVRISSSGNGNDGRQAAGEGQEMAAATDQKVNIFIF